MAVPVSFVGVRVGLQALSERFKDLAKSGRPSDGSPHCGRDSQILWTPRPTVDPVSARSCNDLARLVPLVDVPRSLYRAGMHPFQISFAVRTDDVSSVFSSSKDRTSEQLEIQKSQVVTAVTSHGTCERVGVRAGLGPGITAAQFLDVPAGS